MASIVPRSGLDRYATWVKSRIETISRATDAYRALADLAESVEDEWQYINDLADAYLPSMAALGAAAGGSDLADAQVAAIDEAIAEIALITDPHKAIDWLSTFPHVIALALGGDVDEAAADGRMDGAGGPDDPDDDSPFRMLGRLR